LKRQKSGIACTKRQSHRKKEHLSIERKRERKRERERKGERSSEKRKN